MDSQSSSMICSALSPRDFMISFGSDGFNCSSPVL